ncbi:hypothetical protein EG328_006886 [Venturia inaequalis]|uniref:Uncharacterized protein n=1 Tax=Venturia inaequalis TaxID=5025 RepID=A0A8H3UH33_VENIN|nr:hypothetical protein EG328_006886 [Venturia inaequalis]
MSDSAEEFRGPTPSPSPEPELPQDEATLSDAEVEKPAGQIRDEDMEEPVRLALPTKRKLSVAEAEAGGQDASEAAPKRRKKSTTKPKATKPPKEPKPKKNPVPKPPRKATKPTAAKKPPRGKEVDAENLSVVAQGERPVDQNDEDVLSDADQDADKTAAQAAKFFKEQERARFGVINDVQLSKRIRAKDGLVDSPIQDINDGIPGREQRLLESFFIPFDSDVSEAEAGTVAQRRIDYIQPYTQSPEEAKKKLKGNRESLSKINWRKQSLKHRLNMIEGLQDIENCRPATPGIAWDVLRTRARDIRDELVKGQDWLDEPVSWELYNGGKAVTKPLRRPVAPKSDGKKVDDDDDVDDEDAVKKATANESTKKEDPNAQIWTEEHEAYLQELLQDSEGDKGYKEEAKPPPGQARESKIRIPYSWLELEMSRRFIEATNETDGSEWRQVSANTGRLARAHELFFAKWPLLDKYGTRRDPGRRPDAMYRRLVKRKEFETLFEGTSTNTSTKKGGKGRGAKAEAGSTKSAKLHSETGGKRVPSGMTLADHEENYDEADAEKYRSQLIMPDRRPRARKGPMKSTIPVEEEDGGGNPDEDNGLSDVAMGEPADTGDFGGKYVDKEIQDEGDQEMDDRDGEGDSDHDDDDYSE